MSHQFTPVALWEPEGERTRFSAKVKAFCTTINNKMTCCNIWQRNSRPVPVFVHQIVPQLDNSRHGYMVRGLCSQYAARKCAHLLGLWGTYGAEFPESHSHPDLQLEQISYNMLNLIYNHHSTVKCLNLIHFHLCSLNPEFYALSHHSCGSKSAFFLWSNSQSSNKTPQFVGIDRIGLILTILKTFNPFRFLIHPTFGVLFHTSGSRISFIHELGPSQATTWPRTWA